MVIWLCILLCNLYSKLGFALTSCTLKSSGRHQSGGILVILLYAWVFLKFQSDFSLQLNWQNKPAILSFNVYPYNDQERFLIFHWEKKGST